MRGKIVYSNPPQFFVDDRPVTREEYDRAFPSLLEPMLAAGQPPGCMTDNVFLEGHCNGSQFQDTPGLGDHYAAQARAAGVNPKGKVYLGGLAEFPGDPRAWVGGRGDVQRVCEERGLDCDGAVKVKAFRPQEGEPVGVAPDLIDAEVARVAQASEAPACVDREDLREQVYERRKPHWVK